MILKIHITLFQYEEWNAHDRNLLGYIKTTANPPIFYLPAKTNDSIDVLVAKTKEVIEGDYCLYNAVQMLSELYTQ